MHSLLFDQNWRCLYRHFVLTVSDYYVILCIECIMYNVPTYSVSFWNWRNVIQQSVLALTLATPVDNLVNLLLLFPRKCLYCQPYIEVRSVLDSSRFFSVGSSVIFLDGTSVPGCLSWDKHCFLVLSAGSNRAVWKINLLFTDMSTF